MADFMQAMLILAWILILIALAIGTTRSLEPGAPWVQPINLIVFLVVLVLGFIFGPDALRTIH